MNKRKQSPRPTFEQAKAIYVHRFTMEHVPVWTQRPHEGKYHAPQYRTDREWYDNTLFRGEHSHAGGTNCESYRQTWPMGQWLSAPYVKGRQS